MTPVWLVVVGCWGFCGGGTNEVYTLLLLVVAGVEGKDVGTTHFLGCRVFFF